MDILIIRLEHIMRVCTQPGYDFLEAWSRARILIPTPSQQRAQSSVDVTWYQRALSVDGSLGHGIQSRQRRPRRDAQ
jgi:hypothetical protein